MTKWTQEEAIELCRRIEEIAPQFGAHVALTGGLLYKDGPRKDADILFYRIRQAAEIDKQGLFRALSEELGIGTNRVSACRTGWVHKAVWNGLPIDFFFPEQDNVAVPSDQRVYVWL